MAVRRRRLAERPSEFPVLPDVHGGCCLRAEKVASLPAGRCDLSAGAARFENLVALHRLKFVHSLEDVEGHDVSLHSLRDRDGREVDFLVTAAGRPWFAVEAKLSETAVDPSLACFRDRLGIPWTYQVTLEGAHDVVEDGVRVLP